MDFPDYQDPPENQYSTDIAGQNWAVGLHLSQYCGFVAFYLGFIAPILIWQLKKEEYPSLDVHGKIVTNWVISFFVYSSISIVLCFFVIGFFLLPIVLLLGVVYPLIGAIKASQGEVWRYPLTIDFIK